MHGVLTNPSSNAYKHVYVHVLIARTRAELDSVASLHIG